MRVYKSDFHIGKIIKILRGSMSQKDFAKELRITQKHLCNIETGKNEPRYELLSKIINHLDARLIIKREDVEFIVFIKSHKP